MEILKPFPLREFFEISNAKLSFIFSLRSLEGGIDGPLAGYLADRFGPRLVVFLGVLLGGVGFILLGLTSSFLMFSIVFLGIVPIVALVWGADYWVASSRYVTTENAYVKTNLIQISAEIAGRVKTVFVAENGFVKAGDPIFSIDPEPFKVVYDQAEAKLAMVRNDIGALRASYRESQMAMAEAKQKGAKRVSTVLQIGVTHANMLLQGGALCIALALAIVEIFSDNAISRAMILGNESLDLRLAGIGIVALIGVYIFLKKRG